LMSQTPIPIPNDIKGGARRWYVHGYRKAVEGWSAVPPAWPRKPEYEQALWRGYDDGIRARAKARRKQGE